MASSRDSALGTDMSSIFSLADVSLYTGTDTSSVVEPDECKSTSTVPELACTGSRLAVFGYRHISAKEWETFFVPGRVFIMLRRTMHGENIGGPSVSTHGHQSHKSPTGSGVSRFLVINSKHSQSNCVPIHRSRYHNAPSEVFGPYEVPLCPSIRQRSGAQIDAADE